MRKLREPSHRSPDGGAARAKPRRPSSWAQASTSPAVSTRKPIWIPSRVAVSPRLRTGESSQGVALDEFVTELRGRVESRELWPVAIEGE